MAGYPTYHVNADKRDQIKMRDYMDRRVIPPTWGPPPPCKQTISVFVWTGETIRIR